MEKLISYQNNLLAQTNNKWHRHLFPVLHNENRLVGIRGLRGVGKTTMFLQYLAYEYPNKKQGLYVTADHPYFYENSLFELASEWYKYNGKLLLIDEIHKYPKWSQHLKLIYDGHPDLRILFTSSSALELYKGEADLSRRLVNYTLQGLSFREYLELNHGLSFKVYELNDILNYHDDITTEITKNVKILPLFEQYLKKGYFPFAKDVPDHTLSPRLLQIINTVLESDLAFIEDYSASNIEKLKKLLGVIAKIAPFEPNISNLANKLNMGRNTVNVFLKNLKDAHILNLINKPGKGMTRLQKPDKIYFENTAFVYAFQDNPEIGTVRETFFVNQLINAGHIVHLGPEKADFTVDQKYTFEIGGKNKDNRQIKDIKNSYKAIDNIEYGFASTIPIWLFGFLY